MHERGNKDLVHALAAEILVAAEEYDNGKLTEAQYEAAKAKIVSD